MTEIPDKSIPETLEEKEIKDRLKPYFDERDRRINETLDKFFADQTPYWKIILGSVFFIGSIMITMFVVSTFFMIFWKILNLTE